LLIFATRRPTNEQTKRQFSNDLVNHLSDELASPETTSAQQSILDHHVRTRIQAEISRLREEEEEVKSQIEQALERENIDRERKSAIPGEEEEGVDAEGSGSTDGAVRSSTSLMEDLKEVQSKVERFHQRRSLDDVPEVKASSESLVECYRYDYIPHVKAELTNSFHVHRKNRKTSLDCWIEVAQFKESVARAEQASQVHILTYYITHFRYSEIHRQFTVADIVINKSRWTSLFINSMRIYRLR
jgi:MICOS complex subunit MIC19